MNARDRLAARNQRAEAKRAAPSPSRAPLRSAPAARQGGVKTFKPVRANAGIMADYRRRLEALVAEMHASVMYWIAAAYRANEPIMARDAADDPPADRTKTVDQLMRDLHQQAEADRDAAGATTGTERRRHWTGRITLPSGAVLIEHNDVAGGNTRGSRRGAHMRTTYHVKLPGEKYSKQIGRKALLELLKQEEQLASPAITLQAAVHGMVQRWQSRFDEAAPELGAYFAKQVSERSDAALKAILKKGGFSVPFNPSRAQTDILDATVAASVSLIKSIPQRYLGSVEQLVMQSVQTGRDLGSLSKALQKQFGVTKRRAALIARDQNNKASAAMTRARQVDLGLTKAIWRHSHAGKVPRLTHVRMDGKVYDVQEGMYDPDPKVARKILPGELINCRCYSRTIVPGFS